MASPSASPQPESPKPQVSETAEDTVPEATAERQPSTSPADDTTVAGESSQSNDTKDEPSSPKDDNGASPDTPAPPPNAWQAIYSPQHGAYYFFNTATQETTWTNPLQPETEPAAEPASSAAPPTEDANAEAGPSTSTAASTASSSYAALQAAAAAQGIDPALAYLDPSLAATGPGVGTFTAKFNARTGAFAPADSRDPSHLSEFERAKRMSAFYFDVGKWETEVEERKRKEREDEENGVSAKRKASKKDLERFREQKKQKKIAKTAWLRN
ncbi:hypothetical protein PLICRDRAFT_173643 [Plicaturopsis crispa FD-325 SS-3]|nr:hypothetical protein PLICRDRAFT_173643 [Plicaturopsis crispa FD-325 SS-3]